MTPTPDLTDHLGAARYFVTRDRPPRRRRVSDAIELAMLLTIDWLLDRCRTAINVMGDVTVSCLLDGKERERREALADEPAEPLP